MILYGMFLELHDFYHHTPILVRADQILEVRSTPDYEKGEIVYIFFVGGESPHIIVEEDYETVRGLLGQIYAKKG